MIYTVTLNPSVDYVVHLDSLVAGITNRTNGEEYYFGGKGINVSCVLAELGIESTAFGFVAGFTGDAIEKGIRNDKIITDFIRLRHGISRVNIKIKAETETEINCQGPCVSSNELERMLAKTERICSGDTIVIAGNIPSTMPENIYDVILDRLSGKNVRIVVDATKNLLINSLKYKPFLIKPNKQELYELFDADINDSYNVESYAKKLQKMGAQNVLVSLGKDGAMLIDEFGKKHTLGVLEGKVLNTVGSGDSMVAGFIAGYELGNDYTYALKLGSACGNATAFSKGLAKKDDIYKLIEKF